MLRNTAHIDFLSPWVLCAPFAILGLMCGLIICREANYGLLLIPCVLLAFFLYHQFIGIVMAVYFTLSLMGMTHPSSLFHVPIATSLPFDPMFIVTAVTLAILPIYLLFKNPGKLSELITLRLSWKDYELYFIIFCLWVLATSFFSYDQWQTLKRLLSFVLLYLLFMKVVRVFLLKTDNILALFNLVFFAFLVMVPLHFLHSFSGEAFVPMSTKERSEVLPLGYPVPFGAYASILFNLAVLQALLTKRMAWKIGYISAAVMAICISFFAGIRTHSLSCLVSLVLWCVLGGFVSRKKPVNLAVFSVILASFLGFVVYQNLDLVMYFTFGRESSVEITSGRTAIWEVIIRYTWDNRPLIGIGLGNEDLLLNRILHMFIAGAHNTFVEIFMGTGLVGVIIYTTFIVLSLIGPLRAYRKGKVGDRERTLLLGCFIICVGVLVQSFFQQVLDRPVNPGMQIFLLCVTVAEAIKLSLKGSQVTRREKATGKNFCKVEALGGI